MVKVVRTRGQGAKKLRRRLSLVALFAVLLVACWYGVTSLSKDTRASSTESTSPQSSLLNGAQLAWPATGAAAVGTLEDGLLAHSADSDKPRPTASMAKVITALAVLEKLPLKAGQSGPTYTITAEDVANYREYVAKGGSVLPVYEGMTLTQYQALQAMFLPSANNIADMLAVRTFGSMDAYTAYAQGMLHRMGLDQTVVSDASGFSPDTVSTPADLVAIGIAALKNPVIAEIVGQTQAWIPGAGVVHNTNELLGVDGVIGIKTGTTDQAGNCLLFAARYTGKNGQNSTIVGVVMGDTNSKHLFSDSSKLLASTKQSLGLTTLQPASATAASPPKYRNQILR